MDSIEAAKQYEDETFDFVYIDASHHYDFVKSDILAWYPKVKKGGYIGGHDYTHPNTAHMYADFNDGVYRAVTEIFPDDHLVVDNVSWIKRKQ